MIIDQYNNDGNSNNSACNSEQSTTKIANSRKVRYSKKEIRNRYLFFIVALPFFPIIFTTIFDISIGYSIPQSISNHFSDFYIIVFTTAISVINAVLGIYTLLTKKDKEKYAWHAIIAALCAMSIYIFSYTNKSSILPSAAWALYFANWVVLIWEINIGLKVAQSNNPDYE